MLPFTLGLTGGVASGKTLVEKIFVELGVPVLDADQVSRDVVAPPSAALDRISSEFGSAFLNADGTLNRSRMRNHVFGNLAELKRLEGILHPPMFAKITGWRRQCTGAYCVLSAAILIESPLRQHVDRVLVVDVPLPLQRERLLARDGISESLADSMLAAQLTREQRLQGAHDVVDNSGSVAATRQQIEALHGRYLLAGKAEQRKQPPQY